MVPGTVSDYSRQRLPLGFGLISEWTSRPSVLGRVACRDIFSTMSFRIISGTADQEFVENVESATAALDRVRQLIRLRVPNIRILTENGRACSLEELEGLAEFENELDNS